MVDWKRRSLTVMVAVPSALTLLWFKTGMLALATTLCGLCVIEFEQTIGGALLCQPSDALASNSRLHRLLLVTCCVVACGAAHVDAVLTASTTLFDAAMLLVWLVVFLWHLVRRRPTLALRPNDAFALGLDAVAIVYIINGFTHAIRLRHASTFGFGLQILGLTCAWMCDTGALVIGSLFGRNTPALAPTISPNKTLLGAMAGVVTSGGTVLVLFWLSAQRVGSVTLAFLPSDVSELHQLVLGLALGVLCVLGDLIESLFKRAADVKDSGAFFPGHGGCLDRMDSFLLVAPCLHLWTRFGFGTA